MGWCVCVCVITTRSHTLRGRPLKRLNELGAAGRLFQASVGERRQTGGLEEGWVFAQRGKQVSRTCKVLFFLKLNKLLIRYPIQECEGSVAVFLKFRVEAGFECDLGFQRPPNPKSSLSCESTP